MAIQTALHAAALLLLFHAAYSAYEYRSGLPIQLILQALLALALATTAASLSAPTLKPISVASEMRHRSLDQMDLASLDLHYGNNKASILFAPST